MSRFHKFYIINLFVFFIINIKFTNGQTINENVSTKEIKPVIQQIETSTKELQLNSTKCAECDSLPNKKTSSEVDKFSIVIVKPETLKNTNSNFSKLIAKTFAPGEKISQIGFIFSNDFLGDCPFSIIVLSYRPESKSDRPNDDLGFTHSLHIEYNLKNLTTMSSIKIEAGTDLYTKQVGTKDVPLADLNFVNENSLKIIFEKLLNKSFSIHYGAGVLHQDSKNTNAPQATSHQILFHSNVNTSQNHRYNYVWDGEKTKISPILNIGLKYSKAIMETQNKKIEFNTWFDSEFTSLRNGSIIELKPEASIAWKRKNISPKLFTANETLFHSKGIEFRPVLGLELKYKNWTIHSEFRQPLGSLFNRARYNLPNPKDGAEIGSGLPDAYATLRVFHLIRTSKKK